jgi:preprotein translocase subunit YajC
MKLSFGSQIGAAFFGICVSAAQVLAQTEAASLPPRPSFSEVLSQSLPMVLVVFMIFHFLVQRPAAKKAADQAALLGSLKKGEGVVTTSGLVGKFLSAEDTFATLEIAPNVKIKVEKQSLLKREQGPTAQNSSGQKS